MSTRVWRQVTSLLSVAFALLASGTAVADESWTRAWSFAARGDWTPLVIGSKVVVRGPGQLEALDLLNGKRVWRTKVPKLLEGRQALAAGKRTIYALTRKSLVVIDAAEGTIQYERTLQRPSGLLVASNSVYVADRKGVHRFDASGRRPLGVTSQVGKLEAAGQDHVVLHQPAKGRKRPNRLIAASLKTGALVYKFKLLPRGDHRVAGFANGRLAFIDFTRFRGSANKKKLYFTEADVYRDKKLRDVSLSAQYTQDAADTFEVIRSPTFTGPIFVANHGSPSVPGMLLAYDAEAKRIAWTRSGAVASGPLTLAGDLLWTTVRDVKDGSAGLVAYRTSDGNIVARLSIDGDPRGAPVAVGDYVLVRTHHLLQCFTSSRPPAATPKATAVALPPVPRGFRKHHDDRLGYALYLPQAWRLARKRIRRFGEGRLSVPFIRYEWARGRWQYQASVHVLIRPAVDQTAQQVWQAVLEQRKSRASDVQARRVTSRNVDGVEFVQGKYRFVDSKGLEQQAISLCAVHGGRAYEVRARVNPFAPQSVWKEVVRILGTVRVGRYASQ